MCGGRMPYSSRELEAMREQWQAREAAARREAEEAQALRAAEEIVTAEAQTLRETEKVWAELSDDVEDTKAEHALRRRLSALRR